MFSKVLKNPAVSSAGKTEEKVSPIDVSARTWAVDTLNQKLICT